MNKKTHKIAYKITKDLSMIRKRRGFTLRNLSQVCGISYSNLCNMENCKTGPSLNTLVNVCEALDAEILIKEKNKGIKHERFALEYSCNRSYHWNIIPPDRLFHHILNYF